MNSFHNAIQVQTQAFFSVRFLKNILSTMLNILQEENLFRFENLELELILVQDREMMFYNLQYLSCCGPTNILSFPYAETCKVSPDGVKLYSNLGTMILSVDTLKRESTLYGQKQDIHLIKLLTHGLLHLLGYDHGVEMDNLSNFLEEKILNIYKVEQRYD